MVHTLIFSPIPGQSLSSTASPHPPPIFLNILFHHELSYLIFFVVVVMNPGIKPRSPTLQADSLLSKPPGESRYYFSRCKRNKEIYYCFLMTWKNLMMKSKY